MIKLPLLVFLLIELTTLLTFLYFSIKKKGHK